MDASFLSLYVHIPFCRQRCSYCAFNTYAGQEALIPAYVDALCNEITLVGQAGGRPPVHTVYFGGGTPSVLTPAQLQRILDAIAHAFSMAPGVEVSLEANPTTVAQAYFQALRAIGVNRLSLGAQSAHAAELRLFQRDHDWQAVVASVAAARAAGFDNINLDLIYGIPGQTLSGWRQSLEAVLALQPEHVSLYSLGIEPGTAMQVWVDRGQVAAPDSDLAADMYDLASNIVLQQGYLQYEISNWAKPGFRCRHNLQYWRCQDYLGFGAGAFGYAARFRYAVVDSPWAYIRCLPSVTTASGQAPAFFPISPAVDQDSLEQVEDDQARAEMMILGLRLVQEGVSRAAFEQQFGRPVETYYKAELERLVNTGLITINEECIRLTQQAYLIANQALVNFV